MQLRVNLINLFRNWAGYGKFAISFFLTLSILIALSIDSHTATAASIGRIQITPGSGTIGTSVTVNGDNFTSGQIFTIKLGTNSVKTGTIDLSGKFSASFEIPVLPRGQYSVSVTTGLDTSSTEYFTVTPEIKQDADTGYCGDQIILSGSGFNKNAIVTFFLDSTKAGTTTTNSNGSFIDAAMIVPDCSNGQHMVTAGDSDGKAPAAKFSVSPKISTNPVVGSVSEKMVIIGRGFTANSAVDVLIDGKAEISASIATDAAGSFTNDTFTIPILPFGKHNLKAKDADGHSTSTDFSVSQRLIVTPISGPPGVNVHLSGDGFRPGEAIHIRYNGQEVPSNPPGFTSDTNGSFNGEFKVPGGLPGTYNIEVSDDTNITSAAFQAVVETDISQITSDTSPGNVGMELTINGAGFKPSGDVIITMDSPRPELLAKTTADEVGKFASTFVIPPTKAGLHTITASDGNNVQKFIFVMESVRPPEPVISVPETGTKASRPVRFDWKDVKDDSGVVYALQVSTDNRFNHIVVEKEGLTTSEYILSSNETLKSVVKTSPYYWRVKARDNAGNEGDWSQEQSFYLGFVLTLPNGNPDMTLSALWIYLIVLIAISVVGFAFWLGRYTIQRRRWLLKKIISREISHEDPNIKMLDRT
jgi:hypothetical protein